jgi:clan AA aspartic protease
MELTRAELQLSNFSDVVLCEAGFMKETAVRKIIVDALVDTGSGMLVIDELVKDQLGLKVRDVRTVQLADGTITEMQIVGPLEIRFQDRMTIANAKVLTGGLEVLLGATPIEEMDLVIDPVTEQLIVNPETLLRG